MKFVLCLITSTLASTVLSGLVLASNAEAKGKVAKAAPQAEASQAQEKLPGEEAEFPVKLVADPAANELVDAGGVGLAPIEGAASEASSAPEAKKESLEAKGEKLPVIDTNKAPESEIPVLAETKDAKKAGGGEFHRLILTLGVLVVLLGAASFGVKRWAKRSGKANLNTRIKVLTQHHLGPKKSLVIVQVAGESLLIGVTDQNISMLKSLSLIDDEVPEQVPRDFNQAMDTEVDEDHDHEQGGRGRGSEPENFSMHGLSEIQDVVSKRIRSLRDM